LIKTEVLRGLRAWRLALDSDRVSVPE
jgi:hypothetical protein